MPPREAKCEVCGVPFTTNAPNRKICGDNACRKALRRRRERDRAQGIYTPRATAKWTTVQGINAWGEYDMPCPFHAMDYLPPGVASWHESIMMPVI